MKLGYTTYGMPDTDPGAGLAAIAAAGFAGVEIAVAEAYPTAPAKLSSPARRELRELLGRHGLDLTATLLLMNFLHEDEAVHQANLHTIREAFQLGLDLVPPGNESNPGTGGRPPTTFTIGGKSAWWDDPARRDWLVRRLADVGAVAAEYDCIAAVEPHVNGMAEKPERGAWLMKTLDHPNVKLNFDISHYLAGHLGIADTVPLLVPYAVHTHVKDVVWLPDGTHTFVLPGEGDFDYVAYFRAMERAGWNGYVTVEVSAKVFRKEDYDPFGAVTFCYGVLSKALAKAAAREPQPA